MKLFVSLLILSASLLISLFTLLFLLFRVTVLLFFWGAIYVPTRRKKIEKMIEMADVSPGEKVVDLGSGDGRLVIAFAEAGAEAYGYEVDPFLVYMSRKKIRRAGLEDRAFVKWKSFWKADLSGFDVVLVYGLNHVMARLEKKLKRELKEGSRIVSNTFKFPSWPYKRKEKGVYLYETDPD